MSSSEKILIVEDQAEQRLILRTILEPLAEIFEAQCLEEARQELAKQTFSLIILDASLPDGDGFTFYKSIQESRLHKDSPVIFLTSRSAVDDKVGAFALGAYDYVVKPPVPEEFRARVQALLRRKYQKAFVQGSFRVDLISQKIFIVNEQTAVELQLTPLETKLLIHFLQNEKKVFSKEELIKTIWGTSTHVSTHTIDTHISSLRKKIASVEGGIKAAPKQGYYFETKPKIKS